ncbi:tape measure protein [Lactobacillus crispatus]|uniref:tape measure protein n=1 Tax=Lactobacillus crispatus TaxID=47770 RepID=UPI0001B29C65|nr:tape measure protein [Lactobacillus crispatus]EEU19759.1 tape measure domain protein [Lactobacillus crispatus 125-2-CHN]
MVKISNIMSTTIDINTIKASNSLKSLDTAIRATTNAWKANEARAKSVGSALEASKSRYEGLGKNIENVKSKISYLTEQQSKLDRTTQQGQEEYNKYANKLASAEKQLASMTAQQDRAKRSMDYQKTGLAGLQSSYKLLNELGTSRIQRLEAEGKQYEANKTKLSTYRASIESLTKQQKLQADELVRIGKASGEASEAYKRQQIRLNQTSTTLAKTKNEMNELSGSMRKANPTFLDRIKSKLGSVNKEAGQTHKTFKEVFAGSFIGNALSNAVSNLTGKLKGAVTEGMALNAATAKINARFKSMGMSTKTIADLDKQIGDLKAQTNMTGDNVANLQTKMLNWSNIGIKGAMQMTKMIAGVGDSSKLSGDQIEQMGASLMRVGSTGKVTYSALNRVTKSAPTFMAQLAKGAGMSEDKLKSVLKTGKVTQTQFQKWMASAAKYSDTAFKGFSSTQGGALKFMQVRWQKLEQTMTKPLFDAKTSGLQALKDIMASPELLKGATAIGNALSTTIGYIDKHKKDIAGITSDVTHIGTELGKDMWKDVSGVIGDIGKSFGLIHGNTKKTEDPLHTVKLTMDGLAKNKTAIQWISKAIIAMAAVKGLKAVTSPLTSLATMKIGKSSLIGLLAKGGTGLFKGMLHPIKNATDAMDTLKIHMWNMHDRIEPLTKAFKSGFTKIGKFGQSSWKVITKAWGKANDLGSKAGKGIVKGFKATGHGLASAGKWSWAKLKSGFGAAKSFGQTLGKQLVAGFKKSVQVGKGLFTQKGGAGHLNGLLQSAHSAGGFKNLTTAGKIGTSAAGIGVAVDSATSIVKAIKDKVGSRKQYEDVGTAAGKGIGGAIGLWFGGPAGATIGAKIGGIVGKWGGDAVKNFQNGWNQKKPPKNFWSLENLGWSTHDAFSKIGKWGSDVGKKFGQSLNKGKSFVKKNSKELALTAVSPIAGIPALLYKNNPKFRKWANSVGKNFKQGFNTAKKSVTNFNKSVSKNVSNFNKSVGKKYEQITSGIGKTFKKGWDAAYKHASKGTKQIMRSTASFAKKYVKTQKKANSDTVKNFGSFSKRLKKNHGDLFKTIGQTAKTQLKIEQKRWSSNWKNIKTTTNGIWKGLSQNVSGMYKKLDTATHGGLSKVFNGFEDFGKDIKNFWDDLWKGITKTFDDTVKGLQDAAGNVQKFFTGKLKVGNLHLASGTDWKKKYGYPAILNDGHDSPATGNREGLIHADGSLEILRGTNIKRWIFPGEDVINAHDLATLFGRGVHLANGTVKLRNNKSSKLLSKNNSLIERALKLYKAEVKKRDKRNKDRKDHRNKLDRKREQKNSSSKAERAKAAARAKKEQEQLKKLGDRISSALKHKNGNEVHRLTAEFNRLTKKYSADKKAAKKPDPHAGKVLVDQGLLIGAKSRIGHSVYISKKLFKQLIANLNKKSKKTKRKKTRSTRKRRSTRRRTTRSTRATRRRTTTRRRSTSTSSGVSIKASVSGGSAVTSLASAIKALKSKSVKITAKASGTKAVVSLAKAARKIKGSSHKVAVKAVGVKALTKLYKATKKIKGKTHKVRVKTSGTKGLKSLQKNVTSVHKRIDSLAKATKKDKFGKDIAKQAEEAVKSLKGKGNFAKQFESMTKKFNKDLKNMTKNSKKEFKSMWSDIEHQSKTGQSRLTHEMSTFSSHYKKDWTSLENGVHRTFGQFWAKMKTAAGRGVNNVLRIVNSAVGKIDNVISDFGGSKTAVKQVSLVHYASGTGVFGSSMRRAITGPTLAVLNDGNDSPETGNKETIWNKATNTFGVVQGRNTPMLLGPQHEVFNATESKLLGFTHFASGTGALKKLYEIAKHNWEHPTKTGQSMFNAVSGLTGAMKDLAQGMRSKSENQGVAWWSQLWKMVEDKVNDDDLGPASGLLKAVEELGQNKHYSQGKRMSKFFADCSSLVSRALSKYYHANWATPNGWALTVAGLWQHAHRISRSEAKPGDPVFWLPDTHVGIYAGHGRYYSAYGPNDGGPVGMQAVAPGATFGRFNGLNTEGSKSKGVKIKANTALQKKIRGQVGRGFWKTIQKIADKYGENTGMVGAFKLGGDVTQRARAIANALKKAVPGATREGLAGIIGSWVFESGGLNPSAINPNGGAAGLGQWLDRKPLLMAYARRLGKSWKNPSLQLDFALHGDDSQDTATFKRILKSHGSATSLAYAFSREWERGGFDAQHASAAESIYKALHGYANGGIVNTPQLAMIGEGRGPETVIPWDISKRSRAYQLMTATLAQFKHEDGNDAADRRNSKSDEESREFRETVVFLLQQLVEQKDDKKEKEEHDFMQGVLLLLRQIFNKSSVANIKLTTPAGRTLWEVVEPFSKAEQRAAMIKLRRGLSGR